VIAPLAPGFDDLAELDDIRDVHDLALHYDDVLTALGLDAVRVAGHSFGAMIAAELAAHFPRRVTRLALLSPVGLWRDDRPVADLFAQPFTAIDKMLWAGGAPVGPLATSASAPNEPIEALVTVARGMTAIAKFLWPIPDKGLRRRLYRLTAPTLVVYGEKDAFVPASYAEEFAAALRQVKVAIVPDAGHMAPYEQCDAVNRLLSEFFAAP
jgi:pimeloyl-ACP methyl ester carboxylesterase